jgi:predicted naringenin-chalcone synthase
MIERGAVLADFRSVELARPVRQERLVSYLAWLLASARCAAEGVTSGEAAARVLAEVQRNLRRYAVSPDFIARRQFNAFPACLSDEATGDDALDLPAGFEDLPTRPAGPTLDARMRRFEALAFEVFERWYASQVSAPDELIHVTCAGYASPSPAQRLLAAKRWYATGVTHSYHMGCYGAFPAIRTAVGLLAAESVHAEPKRRVDIVHTEYLSAHVATLQQEPGDLVSMTLFGDGFIGYSLFPSGIYGRSPGLGPGFRVLAFHERQIPGSEDEMTWRLGPHQFDMYLSKRVPLLIREHVVTFARELCRRAGSDLDADKSRMLFAIHPGGPKILAHCCEVLGVADAQVAHARAVFHELGNMSSATVPYILLRLAQDPSVRVGTRVVALGFGPGLTAIGAVLEKVAH